MAVPNEDVLNWTLEGVDKGAEYLLVVKDLIANTYTPVWIMPGESLENKRKMMAKKKFIEDGINISYAKIYFENLHLNSFKSTRS